MYRRSADLQNQGLRRYLGVPDSTTGVVVLKPYDGLSGNPLEKWDVITRIGDTPIDDEGMIDLNADVRLNFEYLVQKDMRDGKVALNVLDDCCTSRSRSRMTDRCSIPGSRGGIRLLHLRPDGDLFRG